MSMTLRNPGFLGALGAITAASFPNLEQWYKADALSGYSHGAGVPLWPDSSGNGRNMETHASGTDPIYTIGKFNTKPTVYFDATARMRDGSFYNVTYPFTIILAEVPNEWNGFRTLTSGSTNCLLSATRNDTLNAYVNGAVGNYRQPPDFITVHALIVPASGSCIYYANGVNRTTGSPGVSGWGFMEMAAAPGEPAMSAIAELAVYSRAMTYDETELLRVALLRKWIGSPITSPTQVPGLALWFRADSISASNNTAWATWSDESGNGANATATAGQQPLYQTNGIATGKPGLYFDGTNDTYNLGNLASLFTNGSAQAFIVFKPDTDSAYALFNTTDSDRWDRYGGNGLGYPGVFRSTRAEAILEMPDSGVHLVSHRSTSEDYRVHVDRSIGAHWTSGSYNAGSSFRIGYNPANNIFLKGWIAEIVVFNRALAFNEQELVEDYLKAKWGLA